MEVIKICSDSIVIKAYRVLEDYGYGEKGNVCMNKSWSMAAGVIRDALLKIGTCELDDTDENCKLIRSILMTVPGFENIVQVDDVTGDFDIEYGCFDNIPQHSGHETSSLSSEPVIIYGFSLKTKPIPLVTPENQTINILIVYNRDVENGDCTSTPLRAYAFHTEIFTRIDKECVIYYGTDKYDFMNVERVVQKKVMDKLCTDGERITKELNL